MTPVVAACLPSGGVGAGGDVLASWAEDLTGRARKDTRGSLRFAFYGRVSTEDWQDPVTSRARQVQQAAMLVAGHGVITEFFDIGESRTLPWARRPQSAALAAQLADPGRGWDAVVIGGYERAFYGSQYASMAPLFEHYGVSLWMPEVGGRVDWHAEDHEDTMMALGLSSKREITRIRVRVRTAMAAQTLEQGRYLGGRPPYGYRIADAGPHPNKAHAAWGRRAHKLEPDPVTAPVVSWMFSQRLAGHSAARITRALNDAGVPCPSAADPGRNPHRTGSGWTLRTVAAILANPRYTGRQVWNRQPSLAVLVDPANTGLGHKQVQRWNLPEGGSSPGTRRMPRWSARPILSPSSRSRCRAVRPVRRCAGTCSPGSSPAAGADGGWNHAGPTAGPRTGAATATPVPPSPTPPGRRTPTSAKTRSCPTWPPWPSSAQATAANRIRTTLASPSRPARPTWQT
jgi:DNA invertase Pin-like site-specific DNA recombinase